MSETDTLLQQEIAEEEINETMLEAFYVYRSLHSDESWGAILSTASAKELPNVDFGMTVYATNEKRAIARARDIYEKIHKFDSARDNIRRFAAATVKSVAKIHLERSNRTKLEDGDVDNIAQETMKVALGLNKKFQEHFDKLEEEFMKGIDGYSGT